jgi:transposase
VALPLLTWSRALRRYLHAALPTTPITQEAIDLILGIYRVEHDTKEHEITGTKAHLGLRRLRAGPIRDELHAWLLQQSHDTDRRVRSRRRSAAR